MKVLLFSDLVIPSGFGRIGNEVGTRLVQRGHQVIGLGLYYSGMQHGLPFWVYPLAGRDIWNEATSMINGHDVDVVISIQDFPYHVSLFRDCPIDWSSKKHLFITAIDGTPVFSEWVAFAKQSDAGMVISEFGVESLRAEGVRVDLCPPGVNTSEFYPADPAEKGALREKIGLPADAYVMSMFCMNQGRKNIPATIEGFNRFAQDKDDAFLYLDMDKLSPGGWDIPRQLVARICSPSVAKRIIYKEDIIQKVSSLRERYCLGDVHSLLSFREGFGLPILESMACGSANIALDWCSGTELMADQKGLLVRRIPYMNYGTWGGARDAMPDMQDYTEKLELLYSNRDLREHLAGNGVRFALKRTWDSTTDAVEAVLKRLGLGVTNASQQSVSNNPSVREPSRSGEMRVPDVSATQPTGDASSGTDSERRLQYNVQFGGNDHSSSEMPTSA